MLTTAMMMMMKNKYLELELELCLYYLLDKYASILIDLEIYDRTSV